MSGRRDVTLFDPNITVRELAATEIWGQDPVHAKQEIYEKMAADLADLLAESGKKRKRDDHPEPAGPVAARRGRGSSLGGSTPCSTARGRRGGTGSDSYRGSSGSSGIYSGSGRSGTDSGRSRLTSGVVTFGRSSDPRGEGRGGIHYSSRGGHWKRPYRSRARGGHRGH